MPFFFGAVFLTVVLTGAAGLVSAVEPVVVIVPAVGGFVVGVVSGFGVVVVVAGFGVVAGGVVPDVVAGSVVSTFTGVTGVVGLGNGVASTFATNSSMPVVLPS